MPDMPRRVLHVDDNAGDRLLVSMALAAIDDGLVVDSAESGEAALALLGVDPGYGAPATVAAPSLPPDLLIVDINMPGMNGFEFVGKLTRHPPFADANILFLSTSRSPADARRAIGHGRSLFAVKPLHYEGLCETLGIALRSFAGQIELPAWGDIRTLGDGDGIVIIRG